MKLKSTLSVLSLAGLALVAAPALGEKPSLVMLDELQRGNWEMRERGGDGTVRNICIDNPRRLIQLRHPGLPCSTVVVEDGPEQVTVQYTCRGHGYGRTQVRRETNRLIQVDTQGIVKGLPFAYSAEGRHTGACTN
ncbi:hypothetical protein GR702_00290 [Novosphingobium sp. FGD1]|jgi:hypothetical protein|uniref:DUF3617 family protein n=1 Tax=Novosphingobium silvae TaxID=2692619 RepID=A0A7X4GDF0_9SPHN|nr:hypothetical protein [Novosphingobium silvae]MYL96211.1 hypothetical protein [Novosphingobium silvae]